MVQLAPSGRAARDPEGHSLSSLVLMEGLSVPGRAGSGSGSVGWGFVGDCKLFGSAFSVAVPALGRAPGKSGKLEFSSRLCLAELD